MKITSIKLLMTMSQLYFDIAATTPIDKDVAALVNKINLENFGNPSSIHSIGQKSHNIIERSRISISKILNCKTSEIFFTSGGSESNNIVLKGLLSSGDHLVTSSYEHPSVLGLSNELEKEGIEVTFIKPNQQGLIEPLTIKQALKKNTRLVSIMYVNNELGTINPIQEIALKSHEKGILFHSDAVQAFGKIPVDLEQIQASFLSLAAHKLYGPKGIGGLFIRKGANLESLIHGGGQESNHRASTENIVGIGGFGMAAKLASINLQENIDHITQLETYFLNQLDEKDIDYKINGTKRIPGVFNVTFYNKDGQRLVMQLDMTGIGISYGAACASGATKVSTMLLDMGLTKKDALSTVRISFGKIHSYEDINTVVCNIHQILSQRKKILISNEG